MSRRPRGNYRGSRSSGKAVGWFAKQELNLRPSVFETDALPLGNLLVSLSELIVSLGGDSWSRTNRACGHSGVAPSPERVGMPWFAPFSVAWGRPSPLSPRYLAAAALPRLVSVCILSGFSEAEAGVEPTCLWALRSCPVAGASGNAGISVNLGRVVGCRCPSRPRYVEPDPVRELGVEPSCLWALRSCSVAGASENAGVFSTSCSGRGEPFPISLRRNSLAGVRVAELLSGIEPGASRGWRASLLAPCGWSSASKRDDTERIWHRQDNFLKCESAQRSPSPSVRRSANSSSTKPHTSKSDSVPYSGYVGIGEPWHSATASASDCANVWSASHSWQ